MRLRDPAFSMIVDWDRFELTLPASCNNVVKAPEPFLFVRCHWFYSPGRHMGAVLHLHEAACSRRRGSLHGLLDLGPSCETLGRREIKS